MGRVAECCSIDALMPCKHVCPTFQGRQQPVVSEARPHTRRPQDLLRAAKIIRGRVLDSQLTQLLQASCDEQMLLHLPIAALG